MLIAKEDSWNLQWTIGFGSRYSRTGSIPSIVDTIRNCLLGSMDPIILRRGLGRCVSLSATRELQDFSGLSY